MWFIRILLFPFALLYGILMMVRNKLFDLKILPSKKFSLPVISVGNLSVGGTGKTPHVEYLTRLLGEENNIAIVSRGYKRKTRGYLLAELTHTHKDIGDEPVQYLRKFSRVTVAVDEKRRRGIENVLKTFPETDVVLLDDAYQHRYVRPGLSILLTDYHQLYVKDFPMPTGSLREFRSGSKRADVIVVSKTPRIFSPLVRRDLTAILAPRKDQKIYYSYVGYEEPVALELTGVPVPDRKKFSYIVMFAGIANSYPLQEYLRDFCNELIVIDFGDHHSYTAKDLIKIFESYDSIISKDKVIFTTEKDAMRLDNLEFATMLEGRPVFYIPVNVSFHDTDVERFDNYILDYVKKNKGKH